MQFFPAQPSHSDSINDISFDFYGKRFATCSNDKDINIWDIIDNKDNKGNHALWRHQNIPRAHQDSIWRLSWAHPEFGQVRICSFSILFAQLLYLYILTYYIDYCFLFTR